MTTTEPFKSASNELTVYVGDVVFSTEAEPLVVESQRAMGVNSEGKIVFKCSESELDLTNLKVNNIYYTVNQVHRLEATQSLVPGFVDAHVHAPQFPNLGVGIDKTLLSWLQKYTFPLEAKYSNVAFARTVYRKVVRLLLSHGTTTASYFATIHKEASLVLAEECEAQGQRALVGKVTMTRNAPDNLLQDPSLAISDAESFILEMERRHFSLVAPIITPRFAISCDGDVLARLGHLAAQHNIRIQRRIP